MELFMIDTPMIKATAYVFYENKPPYKRPYRLDITDKATGKTETREANNTCIFEGFLVWQEHSVLSYERDAWMRSQGYERETPYARWEKVRK